METPRFKTRRLALLNAERPNPNTPRDQTLLPRSNSGGLVIKYPALHLRKGFANHIVVSVSSTVAPRWQPQRNYNLAHVSLTESMK